MASRALAGCFACENVVGLRKCCRGEEGTEGRIEGVVQVRRRLKSRDRL